VEPAFGQIGSDGDGLGPKQPELFDIHVMLFAGDAEQTVAALAERFSIDRDAAERLIEDVPVVVKRAADPDVAAEMLDVLGSLGAQVVLLPAASAVPAETDLLELKVPSLPPPRAPSKLAQAQPAAGWGGLERSAPRRAETADLIARAPLAELDLGGGDEDDRAPLDDSEPPARGVVAASMPPHDDDERLVIAPLFDPDTARATPVGRGVASARTRLEAQAMAAHGESLPPALRGGEDDEEARASAPPDLGLGAVPPLPALGALSSARGPGAPPPPPAHAGTGPAARPAPPPPPRAVAKPLAPGSGLSAAASGRSTYERTLEGSATALPTLSVQGAERTAPVRAAQADTYWSARRPAAAASEAAETKPASPDAAAALPARPARVARNADVAPARSVKSLGRPLFEILAGVLVFVFFAQQDNSILFGNASALAVVLHGFALYGIGMGIREIRS
jgi:hypothetical protein